MRRTAATLVAIVFVAGGAMALQLPQLPPRDGPPASQKPATTGVIRGRFSRADTGEPLRRVSIRVEGVQSSTPGPLPSTLTDDQGRYELRNLSPGRYQLRATRGGFVEVGYGQRRPFEPGRPLDVREGGTLENINFSLPVGSVVSGRVVDEAGEPVARGYVQLARYGYFNGARRIMTLHGDSTDDRWEYRIFGVPPGDYYLLATWGEPHSDSADRSSETRVTLLPHESHNIYSYHERAGGVAGA